MTIELINECKARRQKLQELAPDSAFILFSGDEGHLQRYRAASNFYYLTGFCEPGAVAVIRPGQEEEFVLFIRPRDPELELWDGVRIDVDEAKDKFCCDQVFTYLEFEKNLPHLLAPAKEIHYFLGEDRDRDRMVLEAMDKSKRIDRRSGKSRAKIVDPGDVLGEMRVIKSPFEIMQLQNAAQATVVGHQQAMKYCQAGLNESQIYGLLCGGFYSQRAQREGYSAIVAAGANATVLHYRANNRDLVDGELLLIDAGAEYEFYTADVTRTYPVNGQFTGPQKDIYQAVLDVQKQIIDRAKVHDMSLPELHAKSIILLTEKMIQLKLLTGSVEQNIEGKNYLRYYPHGIGHYLGLDVHDLGRSKVDGLPRRFQESMVITVEPGLYVPVADDKAPIHFRGIGVRIEDDVLITSAGPQVLTKALIKEAGDLEALVGSGLS